MRTRPGRLVAALTGSALLLGSVVAPATAAATRSPGPAALAAAGDTSLPAMTRVQARAAYLAAVCPLNASLAELASAEDGGSWPAVRSAARGVARQQVRTAHQLDHPSRPWPGNVGGPIGAVSDLDMNSAGAMTVLSLAGSLAAYQELSEAMNAGRLPVQQVVTAGMRAVKVVRNRLGLSATGGCPAAR
jgi:hypothetical protein